MELLNLSNFKLDKCCIKFQHNHKQCPFYHYEKDRKRPGDFYSDEICPYIEKNYACPYADKCFMAHNKVEQLYQRQNYKTKFCKYYPSHLSECSYGNFCSFAHEEEEIQINLLHNMVRDADFYIFYFKTVSCPYNQIKHDKKQCPYAHNWQDFRRVPDIYNYAPEVCEYWKTDIFFDDYSEGCPKQINCDKCHGWKELYYHPLIYKVKPCPYNEKCSKEMICPFYHNDLDKRAPSELVVHGVTKFVSFRRKQNFKETTPLLENIKMLAFFNEENALTVENRSRSDQNESKRKSSDSNSNNSFNSAVLLNFEQMEFSSGTQDQRKPSNFESFDKNRSCVDYETSCATKRLISQ